MNRDKLIKDLVQYSFIRNFSDKTIGIIMPSFSESKKFMAELLHAFDQFPDWFKTEVEYSTKRQLRFDTGLTYIMLHNSHYSHSISFDAIYISSKVTDKQLDTYCFMLVQVRSGANSCVIFEDD